MVNNAIKAIRKDRCKMKILKNSIIVASYLLLTALFFAGGYAIGNVSTKNIVAATPEPTAALEAVSDGNIIYGLLLESGKLNLYSIKDNHRELIAEESITEEIYPPDDIRDLKSGLIFDNFDEAQALFENFVS